MDAPPYPVPGNHHDGRSFYFPIKIEGVLVMVLVDTGMMILLITVSFYRQFKSLFGELRPLTTQVQGATGEKLGMHGQTRPLPVQVGKARAPSVFLVMKGGRMEAIHGMDVLEEVGAVVNFDQNTLLTRKSQSCSRCASRIQARDEAALSAGVHDCPHRTAANLWPYGAGHTWRGRGGVHGGPTGADCLLLFPPLAQPGPRVVSPPSPEQSTSIPLPPSSPPSVTHPSPGPLRGKPRAW